MNEECLAMGIEKFRRNEISVEKNKFCYAKSRRDVILVANR